MKRLHALKIETALNGYVVTQDFARETGMMYSTGAPFVFETFDGLTKWLGSNLEVPAEHQKVGQPTTSTRDDDLVIR